MNGGRPLVAVEAVQPRVLATHRVGEGGEADERETEHVYEMNFFSISAIFSRHPWATSLIIMKNVM